MFAKVRREQFKFESNLKVRHVLTGATFSTYNFLSHEDFSLGFENLAHAGETLAHGEEFDPAEIRSVAFQILREHALSVASAV